MKAKYKINPNTIIWAYVTVAWTMSAILVWFRYLHPLFLPLLFLIYNVGFIIFISLYIWKYFKVNGKWE